MIKVELEPGLKIEEGEILEGDWSDEAPGGEGDEATDYEELTGPPQHYSGVGTLKEMFHPGPSSFTSSKLITLKLPDPDQRPPATLAPAPVPNKRIPRPPNAFMLYANTWRRKLANIYPGESNKEISVRLGKLWKSMGQAEKESYFNLAKQVDAEHKMRYPDYVYNPKEARLRKALRDQGRLHRPRQKWKPSSSAIRHSSLSPMMLKQARAEDYRSHTMLQNYNDSFPDLNYPQVHMPPPGDYNLVQPLEQSWYNSYVHGGLQNGGGDFYGRINDNKSDWNNYSDQESPYVSSQINNNNSAEGSPYSSMQSVPQMMGQPMQMEGQMMMNNQDQMMASAPESLLIPDVHSEMMTNGVESAPVETSTPIPIVTKDEDSLPKLDGPQATLVNSEGSIKEVGKDSLKLPGFHQTFGNITEIGRFSQHDDYFESRPAEVISQPPKVSEAIVPKRKPRGRKRKPQEPFPRAGGGYPEAPPPPPSQYVQQEASPQWNNYPPPPQQYCSPEQYHSQWRTHPYHHHHHYHPSYTPPHHHNMGYYQPPHHHYNMDPSPHHYHHYSPSSSAPHLYNHYHQPNWAPREYYHPPSYV